MGVKWTGMDLNELSYAIVAMFKNVEIEAREILEDVARDAVADMRRIIAAAETDTGKERAASGEGLGQPGRIETSAMISDVTYALDSDLDGDVVLDWGWTDHLEEYYLLQEHGTAKIKAMSALQQSYTKAREQLRQRFQDMGLEVN